MKLTRRAFSGATLTTLATLALFGCSGGSTPSDNPTPVPTPTPVPGLRGKAVYHVLNANFKNEIHTVNLDGTGDRILSEGGFASLSPDGTKVYFVYPDTVDSPAVRSLYSINIDGSGRTKLSDDSNFVAQGSLTPDGSKFLYRSPNGRTGIGNTFLYLMNADGTSVHQLPFGQDIYSGKPQLSPDGTRIAYTRGFVDQAHVYVANVDGTGTLNLGPGADPSWAIDGSRIAFTTDDFVGDRRIQKIVTIKPDGTGKQDLPGTIAGDASVSYTPDGAFVVLTRGSLPVPQIVLLRTDGTFVRQLTNGSLSAQVAVAVVQ